MTEGQQNEEQQNDRPPPLSDHDVEVAKMYQDTFKHLMTYCTGAIAIAAAVVSALFKNPEDIWILAASLLAFAIGAGAAVLGLYTTIQFMDHKLPASPGGERGQAGWRSIMQAVQDFPSKWWEGKRARTRYLAYSILFAYLGVLVFAIFALQNLFLR